MFKIYTQELAETLAKSIEGFDAKATEKDYIIKDIVMSTNSTDRHNEVVLQEGIDMTEFIKNPVALIDHSYDVRSIVGTWQNIRKVGGETIADCRLIDTDAGNLIKKLYEAKAIKDVSIGFIAKEREGNVITKAELIECSFVVVGSNRGAKIKEIAGIEYQTLKDAGVIIEEEENEEVKTESKDFSEEIKAIQSDISEIKSLLAKLVNDTTKNTDELEQKELVQSAVRSLNEVLRASKKR